MAFLFVDNFPQNSSRVMQNSIKALELLLLSAGLISTFVMVKGAVNMPYSCEIVFSSLVGFWNSIRCFLSSPLYICIIINFMVVLIAASSAFHRHHETEPNNNDDQIKVTNIEDVQNDVSPPPATPNFTEENDISENNILSSLFINEALMSEPREIKKTTIFNEKIVKNQGSENPKESGEDDDTLEATWKAITGEGKQRAKEKHLKKSETWDMVPPRTTTITITAEESQKPSLKELRKWETFNDAVSIRRRGGLRRDPSMSIDEFNKQVEDFINKFNHDMRLQRQESDQRFLDMVNRGL